MNNLIEIAVAEIKELALIEPKQASKKFELMANTMSDEQLIEVIENIDIVTLTQINSEHDISFPSIISELMSPEQIRDILCQQPLYWEERIRSDVDQLVQHTFSFITYLIRTQQSEEKQADILNCIADSPAGLFYLCIPFIEILLVSPEAEDNEGEAEPVDEDEENENFVNQQTNQMFDEQSYNFSIDNPKSLLTLIAELAPEVEKSIRDLISSENSEWFSIIDKFSQELVMQAKEKNKVSDEYAEVDDMFSFLD